MGRFAIIRVQQRHSRSIVVHRLQGLLGDIFPQISVIQSRARIRDPVRRRIDRRASQDVSGYVGHVVEYDSRRGRVRVDFRRVTERFLTVLPVQRGGLEIVERQSGIGRR